MRRDSLVYFEAKSARRRSRYVWVLVTRGVFAISIFIGLAVVAQSLNRPAGITAPAIDQSGVYYRNCAAAWAAGVAPIYIGQPGYRTELDGDDDGIACEPFRYRRH